MKNKIIFVFLGILLIGSLVIATDFGGEIIGDITKPDIKKDINQDEKDIMKEKYDAEGYEISNCWYVDECYFCDIKIGKLNLDKKMITCDFNKDSKIRRKVCRDNGVCKTKVVNNLTMEELVDKKVINIVKAHTKKKEVKDDDKGLENLRKKWNEELILK